MLLQRMGCHQVSIVIGAVITGTHRKLVAAGITDMAAANVYLKDKYMPAFNAEFTVNASLEAKAFVQWFGGSLDDILCEQYERVVMKDNTVSFEGRILQIPSDDLRHHYVNLLTPRMVWTHPFTALACWHE